MSEDFEKLRDDLKRVVQRLERVEEKVGIDPKQYPDNLDPSGVPKSPVPDIQPGEQVA